MAELDLSDFLKEAAVADLDWLDVDEDEYRAHAVLPRQNLDVKPDLEALWARNDESPVSYLVPNVVPVPTPGIMDPHTMGDLSSVHGNLRQQAFEIAKVARLTLMQSHDVGRLRDELVKRFGIEPLREHRQVLAGVLQERGLLGSYYVAAEDFPGCAQGKANAFVGKYCSSARYVMSKQACGGCCHAQPMSGGGTMCGQFQKEIKAEIPYTPVLAQAVEQAQAGRGKLVQASELVSPKERIRNAYLASAVPRHESYAGQGLEQRKPVLPTSGEAQEQLVAASSLLKKNAAKEKTALDAAPVVDFLHREMVKGLSHEELASSLKLAFDHNLLIRTSAHWTPLLKESGLYGVIYTKQASFDNCHEGADFLAKHNPQVRAIVAGGKCGTCIYNKGRCLLYGKPLVKRAQDVLTPETVQTVLGEHRLAGRLPATMGKTASEWGQSPQEALKRIHAAVRAQAGLPQLGQQGLGAIKGFYGNTVEYASSGVARQQIVKQASRFLNEGLYGQDLLTVLKSRFDPRDIVASQDDLRSILAEQGLQGIYYVDPSVYDDYGRGCDEATRLHGSRLVPYLKQGSKCQSCVYQTKIGYCSKIKKSLVSEPPYENKRLQQQAVLASGASTHVGYEDLVNNAASMMDEYQMQNDLVLDIKATEVPADVTIMFGQGKVKL